ncbi:MFS transporter [Streptomyces sp. NPDC101490]|uniref:MFS transporter n=1 Tax=Streptomyces sp. NPDC101490 TaxID=3366143 RepID=UPI00382DCA8E
MSDTPETPPGAAPATDTPVPQRWPRFTERNPRRRMAALLGVSVASTIQMVDPSLNAAALPKAAEALGMSSGEVTLAASLATLLLAASMLGTGALGDLRGRRPVLLLGAAGTVIGCLITAFATGPLLFVIGRAITGIATAAAFGMALAIIPLLFRREELPKAFGIWLGIQGIMICFASLGGGWLITAFGWRLGFCVVPLLGACATLWAFLTVPDSKAEKARRFDVVGVALAAVALICLIQGFAQVGRYGWGSPVTLGLLTGALLLFAAFAVWERRTPEPAFPLTLFSVRPFLAAVIVGIAFNLGNAAVTMQYPMILQQTLGQNAFTASFVLAMFGAGSIGGAFGAGAVQTRFGIPDRVMFVSGLSVIAAGLLTMVVTTETTPVWVFVVTATVIGFGVTWSQNPQSAVMMRYAPPSMVGSVGAVKPAVGQMGMGLGLGGLIPVVNSLTAASDGTPQQAQANGFGLGMALVAGILVLAAVPIWVMMRPRPSGDTTASGTGTGPRADRRTDTDSASGSGAAQDVPLPTPAAAARP